MKEKSVFYESFGCQMNAFDTEVIASMLEGEGYRTVGSPGEASVIIVNTCSVREHAETRAIGRLNDLSRHRDAVLVVCGCMAQRMGEKLFELVPGIAIVAGTDSYARLPRRIALAAGGGGRASLLERDESVTYDIPGARTSARHRRYLSITRGCGNYCSYCIVPYLRGPVRSKDPDKVVRAVEAMVSTGVKEVTLLGQNVMAYRSGDTDLPGLLRHILAETGITRLRFLTSHPRDVTPGLFDLMSENERLCPHIHLPVQAGSDRILGLMKRGYKRDEYLETVAGARATVPGLAVTTDIIVGFPTETEEDFNDTIDLVRRVRFDAAFTFKYSPRSGTASAERKDDVPPDEKKRRLQILNETIKSIRKEVLGAQVGTHTEILLDDTVQKGEYRFWKGRTPHFRNVLLDCAGLHAGDIVRVTLKRLNNFTFLGEAPARR